MSISCSSILPNAFVSIEIKVVIDDDYDDIMSKTESHNVFPLYTV